MHGLSVSLWQHGISNHRSCSCNKALAMKCLLTPLLHCCPTCRGMLLFPDPYRSKLGSNASALACKEHSAQLCVWKCCISSVRPNFHCVPRCTYDVGGLRSVQHPMLFSGSGYQRTENYVSLIGHLHCISAFNLQHFCCCCNCYWLPRRVQGAHNQPVKEYSHG